MVNMRLGLIPRPTKKDLPVVPNTYGLESHVEQEIERTINVANARYNTALAANGVPVMIWRRQNSGFVCTCQNHRAKVDDEHDDHTPLSDDALTPAPEPSSGLIRVQGSRDRGKREGASTDRVLGVDFGVNTEDPNAKPGFEIETDDETDEHVDGAQFLDQAAYHSFLDSGQNTTTCGICFGSGFVDGYQLYGGQRIVLESHNLQESDGFSLDDDTEDAPVTYTGTEGAVLTWRITLPAFFKTARMTARNNTKKSDVDIHVNGAPPPLSGLLAFKGQAVTITAVAPTDDVSVTHIDIVLQFIEWPRTQMDKITQDLSYNAPEATQTLDFPFSPSIQTLNKEDVFVDTKYNKVWRVNSSTEDKTAKGQMISWQVSATSRTTFDVLSLLSAVQFPDYQLSYRNLDL